MRVRSHPEVTIAIGAQVEKVNFRMKFKVSFTFDSEYEGYVASVPELPGCLSQAKTLDRAIENIKDAIRGYLHVQAKHGNPYIPK